MFLKLIVFFINVWFEKLSFQQVTGDQFLPLNSFFLSHSKCFVLYYVLQFSVALLGHLITALQELSMAGLSGPQGKIMEKLLLLFSTSPQTYQQFREDQEKGELFLSIPNFISFLGLLFLAFSVNLILVIYNGHQSHLGVLKTDAQVPPPENLVCPVRSRTGTSSGDCDVSLVKSHCPSV